MCHGMILSHALPETISTYIEDVSQKYVRQPHHITLRSRVPLPPSPSVRVKTSEPISGRWPLNTPHGG